MASTCAPSTRFLHVANGDCTTDLIERAGIAGARSIWADVLHDGPVPGELTDDQLLRVRAAIDGWSLKIDSESEDWRALQSPIAESISNLQSAV